MGIGILTGGGDCSGINAAIQEIVQYGAPRGHIFWGIPGGWAGLTGEIKKEPQRLTLESVKGIRGEAGTLLRTSRTNPYKLTEQARQEEDPEKKRELFEAGEKTICQVIKSLDDCNIDSLVAIGGEDTLGVAERLCRETGVSVVGLPKTMDNDLSGTDWTIGYWTAVARGTQFLDDLVSTTRSHSRICVLELFGRHVGWVALGVGISANADWVLIPEIPLDFERMCQQLKGVYQRKGYAMVVVSEAIDLGEEISEGEADTFGHIRLVTKGVGEKVAKGIEKETGIETRAIVPTHLVRVGDTVPFDRILARRTARRAVEMIEEGKYGYMAGLQGNEIVDVRLLEAIVRKGVPLDHPFIELMPK